MASKIQVDENIHITEKQHDSLVEFLKKKLLDQKEFHTSQTDKFREIDRAIYGYLVLDEDDEKRRKQNQKGYGLATTDTILPLAQTQLDNAVTYFMEVLAADSGLYGAIAPNEQQKVATGFAALMNENADKFGHEKELNKLLFDGMKYNLGATCVNWKSVKGNKIKSQPGGGVTIESEQVYAGNELKTCDMYNLYYDLAVAPTDVANEGEFFATVDLKSPFKVQKLIEDKELYNLDSVMEKDSFEINWYTVKPKIRAESQNASGGTDWLTLLGGDEITSTTDKALEFVTFNIWLPVKKFGISTDSKMQICRVTVVNNERIARIQVLNNAHAMLPIGIIQPIEDGFKEATKSFGELLIPFQTFASTQMNIHQKASRRSLYGITFFNKNMVNLDDQFDPIAAKIGVNLPPDQDIRKAIMQIFDGPNTENTVRDIDATISLMQQILPTEIAKQVAGLDRATQYQAAATVQGANRRNLKIAKVINSQGISGIKRIQMYNILQFQETVKILTQAGELQEISPVEFRDTRLEFKISDGLKGLDRLSMAMSIKEVLNTVLQSQHASAQIDVVEIINYWTSMIGDNTDFIQFKFKSEIDKLPPEQKDLAFQLLQQFAAQQEGGAETQQTPQLTAGGQ